MSVGMAAIMAVPVLVPPLGLALASTDPVTDASRKQVAAISQAETNTPETAGSFDTLKITLNRSVEDSVFTQHEASRAVALPLSTTITAVTPYTVYVTAGSLNFRSQPSTYSTIIDVLHEGDKLTVTGEATGWKRVQDASGRTGYVSADYVSRNMVFVSVSDTIYVGSGSANLRQAPTTESAILTVLSAGTRLTRTGIGDGWTRVQTSGGTVGYVASRLLTATAPASTSPAITKVVNTAYSMLGVPYVWGSEDRSGVDCSGLTLYCYKQIGITLPRTAAVQATVGTAVSYSNMKPGDIICLDTRNDGYTKVTHVGLYVGGGYMIHASSSNDRVVKANVANYLNYSKLITIRRIVQ